MAGCEGEVDSQIPIGAGMASSAALLVTLVAGLGKLYGAGWDLYQVAELAYVAERQILGVPCGRLDQYGSAFGYISLIHPKPPVKVERLSLEGGVFVVLDSGLRHSTAEVHRRRQEELQQAVYALRQILGVKAEGFWDFPWHILNKDVVELLQEPGRSRVLFTIEMQKSTEKALQVVKSDLPTGEKLRKIGEVMTYQHKLLSALYQVSLPQLDQLVEKAVEAGAYGAKLSGAGLGGVVIALAPDRETAIKIGERSEATRW